MSEPTPPSGAEPPPPAPPSAQPATETPPTETPAAEPAGPDIVEAVNGTAPSDEPLEGPPVVPVATSPVEPIAPARSAGDGIIRLAGYLGAAVAGAALILVGLAATGGLVVPGASPSPSPSPAASPSYMQAAALGDPAAPVTIEIWADYQCPYCALQARGIEPSIERTLVVPGQARLVFRDFAFLGQGRDPDESLAAAVAAQCAGRQDAYWYYHDLLFASQQGENQGGFARENLLGLAKFAGLDEKAFTACLDDATVAAAVKAETQEGKSLGVSSTPTMRITGPGGSELMTGVKALGEVQAAVERMSKPAPSGSPTASPGGSGPASPTASPAASSTASPAVGASPSPGSSPSAGSPSPTS